MVHVFSFGSGLDSIFQNDGQTVMVVEKQNSSWTNAVGFLDREREDKTAGPRFYKIIEGVLYEK